MAKDKRSGATDPTSLEGQAAKIAQESGLGSVRVREDGAICFGNDCVTLKPNANGKLHMEIRPTLCGEATGRILLDYLYKTAGKGVVIEVPPEGSDGKGG